MKRLFWKENFNPKFLKYFFERNLFWLASFLVPFNSHFSTCPARVNEMIEQIAVIRFVSISFIGPFWINWILKLSQCPHYVSTSPNQPSHVISLPNHPNPVDAYVDRPAHQGSKNTRDKSVLDLHSHVLLTRGTGSLTSSCLRSQNVTLPTFHHAGYRHVSLLEKLTCFPFSIYRIEASEFRSFSPVQFQRERERERGAHRNENLVDLENLGFRD